jgi:hypothetical protein
MPWMTVQPQPRHLNAYAWWAKRYDQCSKFGRYMPVHHTETSFCSWISYRHIIFYYIQLPLSFFLTAYPCFVSRGSSGSIVSGYGLYCRAIEVRSPAEAKGFSLYPLCPDRLSGPPSLLYNGHRVVLSPGVKRGRSATLNTHPHLVPRSRMCRSYIFCTSKLLRCV